MLRLLFEVVYLLCGLWEGHRRVERVQASVKLDDVWFHHLFGESCGDDSE